MDSSSLSFPWEDTLGHLTPLQEWRWVVNSLLKPAQDWSLQVVKMVMSESGASLTFLKTKSSQPQMGTTFASECGAKTKIPSFSLTITASYLFLCASKTTQKLNSGTVKKSLKVRKLLSRNREPSAKALKSSQLQLADAGCPLIQTYALLPSLILALTHAICLSSITNLDKLVMMQHLKEKLHSTSHAWWHTSTSLSLSRELLITTF